MSKTFIYTKAMPIDRLFDEIKQMQTAPYNFYSYMGKGTKLRIYQEENNVYVEYPFNSALLGWANPVTGKDLFEAGLEKIIREKCNDKYALRLWCQVKSFYYDVSRRKSATITIHSYCYAYSSFSVKQKRGDSFSNAIQNAQNCLLKYLSERYPKEEGDVFVSTLWESGKNAAEPTTEELICLLNENRDDAKNGVVKLPKEMWKRYFNPHAVLSWGRTQKEDEEETEKLKEDIFVFLQDNVPYRFA